MNSTRRYFWVSDGEYGALVDMIRRADGVEIRLASFVAGETPQVTVTKQYMDLSAYVRKNISWTNIFVCMSLYIFLVVISIVTEE